MNANEEVQQDATMGSPKNSPGAKTRKPFSPSSFLKGAEPVPAEGTPAARTSTSPSSRSRTGGSKGPKPLSDLGENYEKPKWIRNPGPIPARTVPTERDATGVNAWEPRTQSEYIFMAKDIMRREPPTMYLRYPLPLRFAMRDKEVAWERKDPRTGEFLYKELIGGGKNTTEELIEMGWYGKDGHYPVGRRSK